MSSLLPDCQRFTAQQRRANSRTFSPPPTHQVLMAILNSSRARIHAAQEPIASLASIRTAYRQGFFLSAG